MLVLYTKNILSTTLSLSSNFTILQNFFLARTGNVFVSVFKNILIINFVFSIRFIFLFQNCGGSIVSNRHLVVKHECGTNGMYFYYIYFIYFFIVFTHVFFSLVFTMHHNVSMNTLKIIGRIIVNK